MTPADQFASAAKTLRPLGQTSEPVVAIQFSPVAVEQIAQLMDAFEELAHTYPEMAHDHERGPCDDYACDVMGRALDFARGIGGQR